MVTTSRSPIRARPAPERDPPRWWKAGLATEEKLDAATVPERVRAALAEARAVFLPPTLVEARGRPR